MKHFWKMKNRTSIAVISAILSAIFYAICIPSAKILTPFIQSITLGGLLYLGAGIGLTITQIFAKPASNPLTIKELPYMSAVILLDISAITLLMLGLLRTTGANASLLGNFELVVTSLFACIAFKEILTKKVIAAVVIITLASIILTFEKNGSFVFNSGSVFVLLSCICWGLENNCTRMISSKSTKQITAIKGICSGLGSLILAILFKEHFPEVKYIIYALLLGFVSYGLSVSLYIYAQRFLGAVKTGAYYSVTPFFGIVFSLILLGEKPLLQFYIALILMIAGTILVFPDSKHS